MAYALPRLEDVAAQMNAPLPTGLFNRTPVTPPPAPGSLYDALTPEQKKQVDLTLEPRSAVGEIGAGLARGATYELPRLIGQGLKSTGQPGDTLYDIGQNINDFTEGNNARFLEDQTPDAHNVVTQAIAQGAAMLAPSVAPLVAGAALAPFTGGGSLAIAGAAGAGMFGASQYQDTYEKAIKAGKTPDEAHRLGLETGLYEGAGEGVGTVVGGRFLKGLGNIPRVLGRKYGIDEALSGLRKPGFLKEFAKDLGSTAAVETGTEMGQNYAEAAAEKREGVDTTDPWQAATSAIGPTLALTGILAPFGAHALRRTQQRNAALMKIAEGGTAPLQDVQTATGELATQLEPLVGKEQAQLWRLDALAGDTTKRADAWDAQQQAELAEQQQQEQHRQDVASALVPQKAREQGLLPAPGQLSPNPLDASAIDTEAGVHPVLAAHAADAAQQNADALYAARAVEETRQAGLQQALQSATNEQQRSAAVEAIVANPPTGAIPFGAWVAQTMRSDKAQGKLDLPATKRTQAGLKQAYVRYLDTVREETKQASANEREAQGQTELPLEPALNKPVEHPAEPERNVAPLTAMEQAMATAKRRQGMTQVEVEADKAKQADMEKLAGVAATTRTVEQANQLADAALAGKINGNTPVAVSDLRAAWKQAAEEAGIDTGVLRGQNLGRVMQAISSAGGKKLWMQQLVALREKRDAMGKGTVSRDSMSAFITKLENFNGESTVSSEGRSNEGNGKAALPAEVLGAKFQDEAGATTPQRQEEIEQSQAAPTVAAPVAEAAPALPLVGAAEAPVAASVRKSGAQPAARMSLLSTAADDTSYPDLRSGVPDTSLRKAPTLEERTQAAIQRMQKNVAKQARDKLVPVKEQRVTDEKNKYAFELYHYNQKVGRNQGTNTAWVNDFEQASKDAAIPRKTQKQQNAQRALDWLRTYEGEDIVGRGDERVAQLAGIFDTNERARGAAKELGDAINAEIVASLKEASAVRQPEKALGQSKENATKQADEMGGEELQANLPSYVPNPALVKAVESGKLGTVLGELAANGPSEWTRQLAAFLWSRNLPTQIEATNSMVFSENGQQVYGSYNPARDRVSIHTDGANAHTILHETTHAATLRRIAEGLAALQVPYSQQTLVQRAASADLRQLQKVMSQIQKLDTHNQYAFKNEGEFVAETFSNEKFQKWLRGQVIDERSSWAKVVDWVKSAIGFDAVGTALEHAISASLPFFGESRYGGNLGVTFDHSPGGAMASTDGVMSSVAARWDTMLQDHKTLGELSGNTRKAMLAIGTTYHIQQWIAKSPLLSKLVVGMKKFADADSLKTTIMREIGEQTAAVTKQIELAMSKLSFADQTKVGNKMGEFAGEMSRYGVDLNKNFDQNLAQDPTLNPALRADVNRLHNEYKQLDPMLRGALEDAIRVFRKGYVQQTALVMSSVLRNYEKDMGPVVSPLLAKLDIRAKNLDTLVSAYNNSYYADAYSAGIDKQVQEVISTVAAMGKGSLRDDVGEVAQIYYAAVGNPYSHLGRYGDHFVKFNVAPGGVALSAVQRALSPFGKVIGEPGANRHVFLRFENASQKDAAFVALRDLGAAVAPDTLEGGSLFDRGALQRMQGVPQFIRTVMRGIDEQFPTDESAQVRQYLKRQMLDYLPESSAQKALAPRKGGGVPGYEANFLRNFTVRAQGMSTMVANGYTMPHFDESFSQMKDEIEKLQRSDPQAASQATDIYSEINKRFSNSLSPVDSPVIDRVKAFGYNFYLALSPAFWLTNLMQPYQLTLPVLGGRYGFVATAGEMGKASAKALRIVQQTLAAGSSQGNAIGGLKGAALGVLDMKLVLDKAKLTQGEKTLVLRLLAAGQLDVTQGQEQGHLATDSPRWMSTSAKFLSIGSHYTEVVNRLTAGLAGYNLELSRGGDTEKAFARGIDTVRGTQFDYSDRNTGRAFGRHGVAGKVTPLLASFQQYSLQTMELLIRMVRDATFKIPDGATPEMVKQITEDRTAAQKGLVGVMGTTTLLAGTLGLPLANVVARVLDAAMGGDDDPSDVKTSYRAWLAQWAGKDVAEAIARGAPRALLGMDVSSRAGLQDVLPGTRFMTDRRQLKDMLQGGAMNLLGPAVSAGQDLGVGISHMMDGRVMDGLTEALPLALRGPAKAVKLATEGYTTSTGNKLPMEVTPWAEFAQAIGFTPSVKAEQSEVNFAFKQRDNLLRQEKSKLANQLYIAMEQGGDVAGAMQRVQAFNEKNPQYHINPLAGELARARGRAIADLSGVDVAALPRYLPLLERYSFANTR